MLGSVAGINNQETKKEKVATEPFLVNPILLEPDPFSLSPASDQPHPGEFHVCFALGTNFGATSRCKCPHLRPAPTHRREAVERELNAGGGNKRKLQGNLYQERSRRGPPRGGPKHRARIVFDFLIIHPVYRPLSGVNFLRQRGQVFQINCDWGWPMPRTCQA